MTESAARPPLLIVEDDATARRQLRWTFDEYEVVVAEDRGEALAALAQTQAPVVLLDLGLPPDPDGSSEGLRALEQILEQAPATKVIVVTGREEHEVALRAIELGACDFYRKPIQVDEVRFLVQRASRLHRLEAENRRLRSEAGRGPMPGLISMSASMLEVCRLAERAAASDISVLISGESGVGKEVLCRALHQTGPRAEAPMIAINCTAIPENLLESELFGHERGAFTGADRQVKGRFELAEGGTLFLDEIGDMLPALQSKLLRFLQERVIQRVGGREDIRVDVRIVSATHQDLVERVAEGASERISTIASASSPWRFRLCASAPKMRSCSPNTSRNASQKRPGAPLSVSRVTPWPPLRATPGPATCASSRAR